MQKLLGVVFLASLATIVSARPSAEKTIGGDPNRIICRSEDAIGSRIQTKKTCMTAVQWDQLQREERATIERIQAYKPNNGG